MILFLPSRQQNSFLHLVLRLNSSETAVVAQHVVDLMEPEAFLKRVGPPTHCLADGEWSNALPVHRIRME